MSAAVLVRNLASSSSAVLSRVWRAPLERRASARSARRRARDLVSSTGAPVLEGVGVFVVEGFLLDDGSWRAAFSASRAVTRSMSWESGGVRCGC